MPAAVIGVVCSIVIAVAIEGTVYQPLARGRSESLLPVFVASLGIVIAGENLIRLIWGNNTRVLGGFPQHTYSVGNVNFTSLDITLVAITVAITVSLTLLLDRTVLGQQIRAVRGNREMALAVGVNVRRIYLLVFAIATLRKTPRRICFVVNRANQRSTRLNHDAYVGVKWTWNRGRLANQFRISGVLWVP